ncbi:alpha/beta fold hydrolase [Lutibacter sp.]
MKRTYLKRIFISLIIIIIGIYLIPAPKTNFFKLYPINDHYSQSLKNFQAKPTKEVTINGIKWIYYVGGSGSKTILFIHGMGGAYNLWWQQIIKFEKSYKVISYTLPEDINSLQKTSEGILKILETEKIDKFYVVGTSMGGYIAQYLVSTIPDRIEKVVFGNTFPPNNLIAKENKTKSKLLPFLPEIVISKLGEKTLDKKIIPAAKNSKLLKAFLVSLPFSKKQFINRYNIVIDKFTMSPTKYNIKRIPKLIIESDNDPLIQPQLQQQLKKLYKNASVYTFHNEGHFPYINAPKEYNEILWQFFNTENAFTAVEKTIENYFEGRKDANLKQLQLAFSKKANLYTSQNNNILIIPIENYYKKVRLNGVQQAKTSILNGDITGNIANFKTNFEYPKKSYTDYLTLLKTDKGWEIISKTFTKTN